MLTRGLALELAPKIRVVSVAPGAIATERNVEADELAPEIPLGRPGHQRKSRPRRVGRLARGELRQRPSIVVDGALTQQVVEVPPSRKRAGGANTAGPDTRQRVVRSIESP